MRFQVHRTELPYFPTVVDTTKKPFGLFLLTHLEPILYEDDPVLYHRTFPVRTHFQKASCFIFAAKSHNSLYARAVVPTAIEDDYLSPGRQVWNISLNVHLGLFTFGRCRQCNQSEYSRADSFGNSFDDSALASSVATLENHHDLEFFVLDPELQFHQLGLEFRKMPLELFAFQLLGLLRDSSR